MKKILKETGENKLKIMKCKYNAMASATKYENNQLQLKWWPYSSENQYGSVAG